MTRDKRYIIERVDCYTIALLDAPGSQTGDQLTNDDSRLVV